MGTASACLFQMIIHFQSRSLSDDFRSHMKKMTAHFEMKVIYRFIIDFLADLYWQSFGNDDHSLSLFGMRQDFPFGMTGGTFSNDCHIGIALSFRNDGHMTLISEWFWFVVDLLEIYPAPLSFRNEGDGTLISEWQLMIVIWKGRLDFS